MTNHNVPGAQAAMQAAEETAQRAPVATLQWSEVAEPNEQVRYTHVLAESPLGQFSIEWKSWKPHDSYCVHLNGDYLDTAMNLDDAKAIALKKVADMAHALAGYVASVASAPVADDESAPTVPHDEEVAEAWVTASDVDGIAYDGLSFERGYRVGEIAERNRAPVVGEAQLSEYWRGVLDAFHLANTANANRQGRTVEETCAHLVRSLADLANGDAAPQASEAEARGTTCQHRWVSGENQYVAGEVYVCTACRMIRMGPQASEAVRMDYLKSVAREVAADSAAIRAEARNAALEEVAALVGGHSWANATGEVSALIARHIRALKSKAAPIAAEAAHGLRAATAPAPACVLAADHVGMRVDYTGLLGQARGALTHGEVAPALAEMLRQLAVHLKELGQRWYAGDTVVVDELLQLYCIESDARAALSAQPGAQKKESRVGTNTGHGHVWRRPDGYLARCGGPAICRECARDQAQTRHNNKDGGAVYG